MLFRFRRVLERPTAPVSVLFVVVIIAVVTLGAGCPTIPPDAGPNEPAVEPDAGSPEVAPEDAGFEDGGSEDGGAADDAGNVGDDAGSIGDAGVNDAGSDDAGSDDGGTEDAGVDDAGAADAGVDDGGQAEPDAGVVDAGGIEDGGRVDGGNVDGGNVESDGGSIVPDGGASECNNFIVEPGEQCDPPGDRCDDVCQYRGTELTLGDTCATASTLDLSLLSSPTLFILDAEGWADDTDGSCAFDPPVGRDGVVSFTAPFDGTLNVDTFDTDTVLYMFADSCSTAELVCNDDGTNGLGSTLEVALTDGTEYFLVVDLNAAFERPGAFQLQLSFSAP